jgi:hypothetical protein
MRLSRNGSYNRSQIDRKIRSYSISKKNNIEYLERVENHSIEERLRIISCLETKIKRIQESGNKADTFAYWFVFSMTIVVVYGFFGVNFFAYILPSLSFTMTVFPFMIKDFLKRDSEIRERYCNKVLARYQASL